MTNAAIEVHPAKHSVSVFCVLSFLYFAGTTPANAQEFPVPETRDNTIVFDHCRLDFKRPKALPVLKLDHDEWFQVRIKNTDPRKFDYTLTADLTEQLTTAERRTATGLVTDRLVDTTIAMRHHRLFRQYKLKITPVAEVSAPAGDTDREFSPDARELDGLGEGRSSNDAAIDLPLCYDATGVAGAPYELYAIEVSFGVETREWTVDFSGGIAFSGLTNDEFFVKTDDKGTPDAADDTKTVERNPDASDGFRPDIVALANLRNRDLLGPFGLAFGFGIGDDSNPRYFAGGSVTVGDSFVINSGWIGGKVARLKTGQELGAAPIDDNALQGLPTRFSSAFYTGLAFTFVDKKSDFAGKFSVTKKATPEAKAEEPAGEANTGTTSDAAATVSFMSPTVSGATVTFTGSVAPVGNSTNHSVTATIVDDGTETAFVASAAVATGGAFSLRFRPVPPLEPGDYSLRFTLKDGDAAVNVQNPADFAFTIAQP